MIKDIIEVVEENGLVKIFINGTELCQSTKKDFSLELLFEIISDEQSYMNISFAEEE